MTMKIYTLLVHVLVSASCFLNPCAAQERKGPEPGSYTIQQAISDRAQLHTIAFDGLAFITGSFGADCFFPPGKVADFFGFQYMRDNDSNRLGHNTDFLTNISLNVMNILSEDQLNQLVVLAKEQETLYEEFAMKRVLLIRAFRRALEDPQATLNKEAVIRYCSELYAIDGNLSYRRAEVTGKIIHDLTDAQKAAFNQLRFGNSATWPPVKEKLDKRNMSHRAHVGVMTYCSELFSWYKGSIKADIYFCPERHGTYFGGFYLKDYPAMGNKGYSISTSLTGDAGKSFLDILNADQRKLVEDLPLLQKNNMDQIVRLRGETAVLLRKFMAGEHPDKETILDKIREYGKEDGALSYHYATVFASINQTLTQDQRTRLKALRGLDVFPSGIYLFSDPISMPENLNTDLFFPIDSKSKRAF